MLLFKNVSSPLNIHIEQYEGPLDLLLDLIRKHQINIYDIPLARITGQYLQYIEQASALDIELSAEFVYMAATLIHIKSKTMLPRDPELEKLDPQGDPRQELVDRLIEHERFKNAAEMLQQKRLVEEAAWSNPALKDFLADMIHYLKNILRDTRKGASVSATELFERQRSRHAMIAMFLAILEMVKNQAIKLVQMEAFGDIGLAKTDRFEEAFPEGEAIARLEEEYS